MQETSFGQRIIMRSLQPSLRALQPQNPVGGTKQFRPNNIFGFMGREFSSVPECIDFCSWWLRKHYFNEWGRYYRGGTIEAIGSIWCPDDGEWAKLVSGIYLQLSEG